MAEADLAVKELSRSVNRSSGNTERMFRQAASDNNRNISKITKDLATVVASQRRDLNKLASQISESSDNSANIGPKIDQQNTLTQESISLQNSIIGELRGIKSGITKIADFLTSTSGFGLMGLLGLGGRGGRALGGAATALTAGAVGAGAGYLAANGGIPVPKQGAFSNLPEDQKVEAILKTIRGKESQGDYRTTSFAEGAGSTASGGYQFADATWQAQASKLDPEIARQYKRAKDAPPEIQDAVARNYVKDILRRNNGDISAVPREWYAGPKGYLTQNELDVNRGLTLEKYTEDWMKNFNQVSSGMGGGAVTPSSVPGSQNSRDTVSLAETMMGKHEVRDNREIQDFLKSGGVNMNPAVEAWCAAFVNSILAQSGQRGTGSQVATSFLNWGTPVPANQIQRGDVVVETNGRGAGQTGGHVGIATGRVEGSRIEVISGNYGNKVAKDWVDANSSEIQIRRGSGGTQMANQSQMPQMGTGLPAGGGMGMGGPGMDAMMMGAMLGGPRGMMIGGLVGAIAPMLTGLLGGGQRTDMFTPPPTSGLEPRISTSQPEERPQIIPQESNRARELNERATEERARQQRAQEMPEHLRTNNSAEESNSEYWTRNAEPNLRPGYNDSTDRSETSWISRLFGYYGTDLGNTIRFG